MDSSIALAPFARIPAPSRLAPPETSLPAPGPKFDSYLDGVRGAERRARFDPPVSSEPDEVEELPAGDSDDAGEANESHAETEDAVNSEAPAVQTPVSTEQTSAVEAVNPAAANSPGWITPESPSGFNRAQNVQHGDPVTGTQVDIQIRPTPDAAHVEQPAPTEGGQNSNSRPTQFGTHSGEPLSNQTVAAKTELIQPTRDVSPLPPEETTPRPVLFKNRGAVRYEANPTADAVRQSDRPVPPGQTNLQKSEVAQQVAPQKFVQAATTQHEVDRRAAGDRAKADRSLESLLGRTVAADPRIKGLSDRGESGQSRSFNSRGNPPDHAVVARPNITGGQGDGTAASIARFLVTPNAESSSQSAATLDANTSPVSGTASVSSNPSGLAAGSSAFAVADASVTVSDLLTPSESGEPIESAAKILSTSLRGGRHNAVLLLDPPELGQLRLDVHMHKDAMTLRVTAETQAVARLIESRIPELRDALAQHGVHIDRSEVTIRSAPTTDLGGQSTANSDGQPSSATTGGNEFSQGSSTADAGAQEFAAPGDGEAAQAQQDADELTGAVAEEAAEDLTTDGAGALIDAESPREWVNLVA